MAVVNITYDTKTKKKTVSMDGKELGDVAQIGLYCYDKDEDHIEITSVVRNEDDDMYERRCIYASYEQKTLEPVLDLDKLSNNIMKSWVR